MTMSSRSVRLEGLVGLELAVVAQYCPPDVDQAAGQRDQRLGVDLSGSFALV